MKVTIQHGYQPPTPPREPDVVFVELSVEQAEALAAVAGAIGGPHRSTFESYSTASTVLSTCGYLHIAHYRPSPSVNFAYPRSTEEWREALKSIGYAVSKALQSR